MSLSKQQVSAESNTVSHGDVVEGDEGFKDEPPDTAYLYYPHHNLDLDAFATSSLQAAASAILSAQQQQRHHQQQQQHQPADSSTNDVKKEERRSSRNSSPINGAKARSASSSLSRSSSISKSMQSAAANSGDKNALHAERHMWTQEETKALVDGCNKHGIGNWKAILNDEEFSKGFNGRTPGDLKDRFRTYFPDAYHELYPNAKTHTSRAVRSKAPDGKSIFEKGKTKERRPFTAAEDEVLRKGYEQFGSHWAIIAKDAVFEGRRKSTDLRDRFRNAFPSLYEQAGYKPRAKAPKKERRQSNGGSFSSHDQAPAMPAEWKAEGSSSQQRPVLEARSETSASAHSQAVSEHSEHSDDDSDVLSKGHGKDRSDVSHQSTSSVSYSQGQTVSNWTSSQASSMDRSASFGSSTTSEQQSQQCESVKAPSSHTVPSHTSQKISQPLRRTQSTKRANCKLASLDYVVKTAYTKSSKEAALATHQSQHQHQHHQQQQQQQQRMPMQELASGSQRPALGQSFSTGWVPRFSWLANGASNGNSLANMDLDQMDELMNSHSASELLNAEDSVSVLPNQITEASQGEEVMNIDEEPSTHTNDFSHLYQHLGLTSSSSPGNRSLAVESFQDLLDPVLPPSNHSISNWDQPAAANVTWIPVSSATAALNGTVAAHASTNATRREHEHNQWAGDLLHRGNYNDSPNVQSFVSMASMHLSNGMQGISQSRSADDNIGQQQQQQQRGNNDYLFTRPTATATNQPLLERYTILLTILCALIVNKTGK